MIFVLILVIALAIAYFAFGYADPDVNRRCPDCGLQELSVVYPGHVDVVTRFHCDACGAEYREDPSGALVRED
jgi:rubredoxin